MVFRRARLSLPLLLIAFMLRTGDQRIAGAMDLISLERLKQHVRNLDFERVPEGHTEGLERAAQYIERELSNAGLRVRREKLEWEGRWFDNIVAEKKGDRFPARTLILGAHYDTVPGSPGADDNASAVAVLLEVARALQRLNLESSVRLIGFTLEEYGYVGSKYHARKARQEGEIILGMISLEMLGFTSPEQRYPGGLNPKYLPTVGDFIGVIGNKRSEKLLERVRGTFKKHVPNLPAEFLVVVGDEQGFEEARLSDHSPFWNEGYPALMVTDTAFLRNPHYHGPTDTIDTLDFEFMRKVAAGIYYAVVELTNHARLDH